MTRFPLTPLLAGAILIVLLNTWFAVGSVHTLSQSEQWLAHTWQVIGQVEQIVDTTRAGESNARGFVITGNERFLGAYFDARRDAEPEIDAFVHLAGDNPRQVMNAAVLRQQTRERFAALDDIIHIRSTGAAGVADAAVAAEAGFLQMDRLRTSANEMEAEERRLLVIREQEVRRNSFVAFFAIALASGLDLFLVVFVGRTLIRERQLRVRSEETSRNLVVANEEIARNAEHIHKLNADLEERVRLRTAELESTNRELEAFSYSVSHDLRAPLRTIDGFSLALQEDYHGVVDEAGRDYIQRVRSGVQRMGSLIDALLQLSRITRAELTREEVDVSALAEAVARELRDQNPSQILEIHVQPGMRAFADPGLVRVALENLMNNAVKFSSKVPVSVIHVSHDAATATFQVSDNGAGFDMAYSSKLFNAFNRLHGDKDFKGSGIGLATVARVVRRHHGTITAESALGNGARFRFTLG